MCFFACRNFFPVFFREGGRQVSYILGWVIYGGAAFFFFFFFWGSSFLVREVWKVLILFL
jgi:hypothetical protein